MAPVLSGVWWGPEAGVVGSGAAAAATGVASWLGSGQLVLAVGLSGLTALLLVSVMLLLCASCQGQKKAASEHPAGDHENLMNGQVSEKDTVSQSADSPVTDVAVSSSHNGPLTSGTILSDTQDSSPQPSEDMLSSQSELRSSKCPQDRELPSIPPNNALMGDGPPPSGESTYEVVKEIAAASRDLSAEDSLYETVKELKDPAGAAGAGLPNGAAQPSPDEPPPHPCHLPNHHQHHSSLLNGHLSPSTPERGPLCTGVEYASIDLNKKSRHSADLEARRRSANAAAAPQRRPLDDAQEEEVPPPVPEKVLDENDNQPMLTNGLVGAGLHNGELHSPLSPPAPGFDNHLLADKEAAVYSTVQRADGEDGVNEDDREHDYSSIAELKGLVPASSSSDLYATVRDIYARPGDDEGRPGDRPACDSADPGYETIRVPKQTSSSSDEERRAGPEGEGAGEGEGPEGGKAEPDYESVGELGLSRETSRL